MDDKIRVVLVKSWEITPGHFEKIISSEPSMELVGEYKDGLTAIAGCVQTEPDVVLVEWALPDMYGYELVEALRSFCPSTLVMIIEHGLTADMLQAAITVGARYFMPYDFDQQETISIIKDALQFKANNEL
jgi:DNA-binding NarL/FixJ family response regulator